MRRLVFCVLFLPNVLMADMSDVGRNTLINICTTAQKSSDLGTIRNVASQLKDAERPDDIMLGKQYDKCLLIAYGELPSSVDVEALLNKINETAEQLHADCRSLLNAFPEVAISNSICKDILLK
jgi:citrate synthase